MSKADVIQSKLWKGYGKVAKSFGSDYDVYRSEFTSDPITDANYIDRKMVAFSLDPKFSSSGDEGLNGWICWIDGRLNTLFNIQQGDMLIEPGTNDTYVVIAAQRHLPIRAIKANDRITVNRVGYTSSSTGYAPGDVVVAYDVPCRIDRSDSSANTFGYNPASSNVATGLMAATIIMWDPEHLIQIGDMVVDQESYRTQVVAITYTDIGTRLSVRALES